MRTTSQCSKGSHAGGFIASGCYLSVFNYSSANEYCPTTKVYRRQRLCIPKYLQGRARSMFSAPLT